MYSNPTVSTTDKPSISAVALLVALLGFGCIMVGYLALPFAAALYAMLLLYENKNGRILSYVIPVLIFAINIFINGFFSLEGVGYVCCGALVYFLYTKEKSKSETAFWLSALVLVLMCVSAVLLAFDEIGAARASAVEEFYTDLYITQKDKFIEFITSLKRANEEGITLYLFNSAEAESMFNSILLLIIPLFAISSFVISGICLKLFSSQLNKYSSTKEKIADWHFMTTSTVAYFYIIISIISVIADVGILATVISTMDMIFLVVFAYIGAKVFTTVLVATKGKGFTVMVFIVSFLLLPSFAIRVLSYLGVYFTIVTSKANTKS